VGKEVGLEVVDPHERLFQSIGQPLGRREADEEGSHQPRPEGRPHKVELGGLDPRLLEGLLEDEGQLPQVVP
jgi:hypothetical protein